jgi:hypothetical protein
MHTHLPPHLRPRREKVFAGTETTTPLDGNAKARIVTLARALMRRVEPRKHYGKITAKAYKVLEALLGFHNAKRGCCFPKYETLAAAADCDRSTVAEALKMLEAAGLLTWVHRLVRVQEAARDLFGHAVTRWRVLRSSNGYTLIDPSPRRCGGARMESAVIRSAAVPNSSKSDYSPETGATKRESTSGESTLGESSVTETVTEPLEALITAAFPTSREAVPDLLEILALRCEVRAMLFQDFATDDPYVVAAVGEHTVVMLHRSFEGFSAGATADLHGLLAPCNANRAVV